MESEQLKQTRYLGKRHLWHQWWLYWNVKMQLNGEIKSKIVLEKSSLIRCHCHNVWFHLHYSPLCYLSSKDLFGNIIQTKSLFLAQRRPDRHLGTMQ